jgi:hypothetical protein
MGKRNTGENSQRVYSGRFYDTKWTVIQTNFNRRLTAIVYLLTKVNSASFPKTAIQIFSFYRR